MRSMSVAGENNLDPIIIVSGTVSSSTGETKDGGVYGFNPTDGSTYWQYLWDEGTGFDHYIFHLESTSDG
jgi:outer membrane protein assembly factor BamB